MKALALILMLAGVLARLVSASEELPVPLKSIELQGPDHEGAPVTLTVATNRVGQISRIQISAFGVDSELTEKDLQRFSEFQFSEVQLKSEGGYEVTGGFTIYFLLSHKGFFGGDPFEGDPLIKETLRITLQKGRGPKLSISRKESK